MGFVIFLKKLGGVYLLGVNAYLKGDLDMPIDALIQEAKGMTDETLMEVVHFMQYLKIAPLRKSSFSFAFAGESKKTVYRKPGLYKDQIRIAAGFDDPLDDFKEYM